MTQHAVSKGDTELFIDTLIVNNEERTVERAARRVLPNIALKQFRYIRLERGQEPSSILSKLSLFNPHKEIAYVRRGGKISQWNNAAKTEDALAASPLEGTMLLRFDEEDASEGVCYVCSGVGEREMQSDAIREIFANPHASALHQISCT